MWTANTIVTRIQMSIFDNFLAARYTNCNTDFSWLLFGQVMSPKMLVQLETFDLAVRFNPALSFGPRTRQTRQLGCPVVAAIFVVLAIARVSGTAVRGELESTGKEGSKHRGTRGDDTDIDLETVSCVSSRFEGSNRLLAG